MKDRTLGIQRTHYRHVTLKSAQCRYQRAAGCLRVREVGFRYWPFYCTSIHPQMFNGSVLREAQQSHEWYINLRCPRYRIYFGSCSK